MLDTLDQLAQDAMGGGGRRGVRGVRAAALLLAVAAVGTLLVQLAGRRDDAPEGWRGANRPPADSLRTAPGGGARAVAGSGRDRSGGAAAGDGAVLLVTGGAETDLRMAEPVPVVLSRAESLAIAAAVRTRQASPPLPGPSAARADSAALGRERAALLEAVGQLFADSLARALQRARADTASQRAARVLPADTGTARARITPLLAPQRDGRARLVVLPYTNATGDRALAQAGRELVAALRGGVPADSVMVVDSATTALAIRASRDPMAVGWSLRADFVVSGMVLPRGDSVGLVTQFTDVRDGRFVRAAETVVSPARPAAGTAAALVQLRAWMDSARVVRTRRGTAAARGGGGAAGGPREGPPGPPRGDGPPRPPRG
jgi:serine/threonine-protein kinase